jgi:exodeoxyribonuclease VII small subunit
MADEKKPSISADFSELEALVSEFESGDIDIEEGMTKFKRGVELAKSLRTRLETLENEIQEIKADFVEQNEA